MKKRFCSTLIAIFIAFYANVHVFAQDKCDVNDIKGIWISNLMYNEFNEEYEPIPEESIISFGFTTGKGKLNNERYTGLYRKINEGRRPRLFYYSLENNKVQLYDSSDTPLSYSLQIESVIPNVLMIATLIQKNDDVEIKSKMKFLYYEK